MTGDLKTVEGQITAINHEKRGIAVKDKAGITHPFYWSENFKMVNRKGEPLKQWWFVRITAELRKSDDTWWVSSQEYYQKPADWPATKKEGGRYDPAYQKQITFQGILNAAIETYKKIMPFVENEYKPEDAYDILRIQRIYLKALDEYLEKGTDGINIPPTPQQ
jgi:hypothetical protein